MTYATTSARSAAGQRHTATATQGTACDCRSKCKVGSGFAPITSQTQSDVWLRLLEWERLLWLHRAHQAKRQHRNSQIYLDKARDVMGRILTQGKTQ